MNPKPHFILGLMAHVDAGKTTVCERLLYESGMISSFGRADKGESLLDYLPIERRRGITIFSKSALIETPEVDITLLDTPGHEDFFGEALRAMQVMDACLLIIDGTKPVTEYTKRLYFALFEQGIPTIIFFNKMDISFREPLEILKDGVGAFETDIIDMTDEPDILFDALSMLSEEAMEEYLDTGTLSGETISALISRRAFIPAFFGSALKGPGTPKISEILAHIGLNNLKDSDHIPVPFRISFDKSTRLTHLKVGSAPLHLKETIGDEKIEEIRLYKGDRYESLKEASPGMCVALRGITGLTVTETDLFRRLGCQGAAYILNLPAGSDVKKSYDKLSLFFLQFPECHLYLNVNTNTIYLNIPGPVLEQVLRELIPAETGIPVSFEKYEVPEMLPDYWDLESDSGFESPFDTDEELPPDDSIRDENGRLKADYTEKIYHLGLEEIESIIKRAGGSNRKSDTDFKRTYWNRHKKEAPSDSYPALPIKPSKPKALGEEYLLVDGYNCVFAWEELTSISAANIDGARDALIDILSEYAAFTHKNVILVFDAYKVSGGIGSVQKIAGIDVVYTKEAQTADAYIEQTSHKLTKENRVTVATSDRLEQMIVRGHGALVLSARDLLYEIAAAKSGISEKIEKSNSGEIRQKVLPKESGLSVPHPDI